MGKFAHSYIFEVGEKMPKIKNALIKERKEEIRTEEEQASLRQRHHVSDPNILVVEKKGGLRLALTIVGGIIRYIAEILLVIFAIIGVLSIIYPTPREALLKVFWDALGVIRTNFGL